MTASNQFTARGHPASKRASLQPRYKGAEITKVAEVPHAQALCYSANRFLGFFEVSKELKNARFCFHRLCSHAERDYGYRCNFCSFV